MAGRGVSRRFAVKAAGVAALGCALGALPGCGGSVANNVAPSNTSSGDSSHSVVGADWIDPATYRSTSKASDYELQSTVLFLFDTVVTLKAYCAPELMDKMTERCNFFEQTLSRTIKGSDVWNINNAGGKPVEVQEETADCIRKAVAYAEATDGLFDVTIGAVSSLWDFVEGVKPDDAAIADAVKHVDYRAISVEGATVTLSDPEAMLDLGGIAKGYIADDIAQMLMREDCPCAILNLGGNAYTIGSMPDGKDFTVGVSSQVDGVQEIVASVPAKTASIVTSGLYEREFEQDGVLYYHILDPKTGYPVETDLVSDSLLCSSSTDGDVYATVLFLQGRDKALAFVEGDDRFEALLVGKDGAITCSSDAFTVAG